MDGERLVAPAARVSIFVFSSRRRHTRFDCDWSSDVCSSDLGHIRIHGYLASPLFGGPYPAIVIGHGHHGHGNPNEAMLLAAFGYVALSIDGPDRKSVV